MTNIIPPNTVQVEVTNPTPQTITVIPATRPNVSVSLGGAAYRTAFDAIVTSEIAGQNLEAMRVVVFDGNDKIVYASASNPAHANRVAGMTLTAASVGEPVKIVRHGIMRAEAVEAGWDDDALWDDSEIWLDQNTSATFLGENGLLTNGMPQPGRFLLKVIQWQSSDSFLFSPQQPIFIDA